MARTKRKENPVLPSSAPKPQKQRIYRTGGYARLSVEDSGKPGADTIDNQKELIKSYIGSQPDMELMGLYCDNGQTGTDFARPEFERLMEDVKAGKIDCIVVKDLSRFGRNYRETGNYLERIFPFLDVRFVAVSDHFDTLSAERTSDGYIIPLKNIINEAYSRDISKKVGSAYAIKQRRGEFTGTWAAYGYRRCADDPHRIEPDGETAPVVRDIFRWRLSGMGYTQIARQLNRQGIASPSRYHYLKGDAKCERYAYAEWSTSMVQRILSNEVYIGHMVQGRKRQSFCEGEKQKVLPESEWTVVRDTHEPLIDEDTFQAVREMAQEQKAAYHEQCGKRPGTPNLLKGLVYCADCGRTMTRTKSMNCKGTKVYYSFVCRTHSADPESCPLKSMPEAKLLEILWDTLKRQLEYAGSLSEQVKQFSLSPQSADFDAALEREADAAAQALKRTQTLYDSLYPMYAEEEKKKAHAAQMKRNPWLTACSGFSDADCMTEELARTLISRIEIGTGGRVSIELRYQDEYRQLVQLLETEGKAVGV